MSQPLDVNYPSPNIPTQYSPHSKGSFAPVLIVLAVIFVLVIISVIVGRICNRRYHCSKAEQFRGHVPHRKGKKAKQNDKFHHQPAGELGDIEFGFDKRFASSKAAANVHHFDGPKMSLGEAKAPMRFADDDHIEFRAGA